MSLVIALVASTTNAYADGMVVDKVYHPYVLPNETEIEWRLISRQTDDGSTLAQRLGYGHSISEYITIEGYLIGEEDHNGDFGLQAYEIELRTMLTDQGEYWADWGALVEFEKQHDADNYEFTAGLLVEKEFGRTSLTLNGFIVHEWGEYIDAEWETEFRLQYRYRYISELQPAIEIYAGEDYFGIGPAFMGLHRFNKQKQLKWEAGFITEISNSGKDHSLRFALEYEF
ncbi:hypothetical protein AADZ86_00015 [Colwelliaceae bacterium BS250]